LCTGADPKSVFCAFFKQGLCKKGDKCKFSHDPAVERRSAKRNVYADEKDEKEEDKMEDWDEEKLQDVVSKKHGTEKSNQTEIVSWLGLGHHPAPSLARNGNLEKLRIFQWVETNPSNICKHLYTDVHFYHLMVLR
jgi:hypothetical protein